jgi:hypothetical protein
MDDLTKIFSKKIELKTKIYEPLSTIDLQFLIKRMKVTSCLGVLSKEDVRNIVESTPLSNPFFTLIFNLDEEGPGSHWVAACVTAGTRGLKEVYYFDSFSDAYPPLELKTSKTEFFRNLDQFQDVDDPPICGHLCLGFCYLSHITRGDMSRVLKEMTFKERLLKLINLNLVEEEM